MKAHPRPPHRAAPVHHTERQGGASPEVGGFTLIEMLLAVAIFAIVLTAIHMVFYGALQLRNKTSDEIERGLPLQQALTILKRDLANLVLPGQTLLGELQSSTSIGSSTNELSLLSPIPDSIIGQSSPAFFTASGTIDDQLPWGDILRVVYFLAPPTNNTSGKDLIRSVTRNLLPTFPEEPEDQRLLQGLQTLTFSYYDGSQWREYWDSSIETNRLPLGIKVELQFMTEDSSRTRRPPIELVVPVVLRAGTNQVGSTEGAAL